MAIDIAKERALEARLLRFSMAILIGLVIGFAYAMLSADGLWIVSGTLGGDYPAFHAAGSLVLQGRSAELYDWSVQEAAQAGLHPDRPGSFLSFAYPPFVALLYAPLALLPFKWGYLLHTLLMAGLLAVSARIVTPMLPRIGRYPFVLFVGMLIFYPMLRAVLGGQNAALTLFLMSLVWRALHDRHELLAGVAAGLLLYKPQYGLPLIGLVSLTRRPRVVMGWLAAAGGLYLLGALVGGLNWLPWWWGQVGRFQATDQAVNAANSVGVLGFLEAVMGTGSPSALVVGVLLAGLLAMGLLLLWWRPGVSLNARMAITGTAVVLMAPHAMFYDAGLALLGMAYVAEVWRRGAVTWLGVMFLASFLTPLSTYLGFNTLFLVLLLVLGSLVWQELQGSSRRSGGN